MASIFERPDTSPVDLPEPYAALMAFLDDLHEQAELFERQNPGNPFVAELLGTLRMRIVGLAVVVSSKAAG